MAMGMCACWADVVQEELLEQLCPEEFKRFTNALLEMEVSQEEFVSVQPILHIHN